MNKEQKDIELIEAYIKGNISENQIRELKKRLEVDQEFQELYFDIVLIAKESKSNLLNEKAVILNSLSEKLGPVKNDAKNKVINKRYFFFILILILGLLYAGSKIIFFPNNDNKLTAEALFAREFNPPKYYDISRSTNSLKDLKKSAAQNYTSENYDLSAIDFEQLFIAENDTMNIFYAAISNLAIKNLKKAEQQFLICKNATNIRKDKWEINFMLMKLRRGDTDAYNYFIKK